MTTSTTSARRSRSKNLKSTAIAVQGEDKTVFEVGDIVAYPHMLDRPMKILEIHGDSLRVEQRKGGAKITAAASLVVRLSAEAWDLAENDQQITESTAAEELEAIELEREQAESNTQSFKVGDRVRISDRYDGRNVAFFRGKVGTVESAEDGYLKVCVDGHTRNGIRRANVQIDHAEALNEGAIEPVEVVRFTDNFPEPVETEASECAIEPIQPEVITTTDEDRAIESLYSELVSAEQQADAAIQSTTEKYYKLGAALLERRSGFKRGDWLPWLSERGIPERRAQRAMQIAKHFGEKSDSLSLFSLEGALNQVQVKLPPAEEFTFAEVKAEYDLIYLDGFKRCTGRFKYIFEIPHWSKAFDNLAEAMQLLNYCREVAPKYSKAVAAMPPYEPAPTDSALPSQRFSEGSAAEDEDIDEVIDDGDRPPIIQNPELGNKPLEPHPQECWHQCFVVVKSSVRSFSNFQQKGWSDEAIENIANQVIEFLSVVEV